MYRRSRIRIAAAITGSLLILFVLIFSVIFFTNYREIAKKNTEMLDRYVEMYSLDIFLGEQKEPSDGFPAGGPPDFQLSTFYSVALSDDREILAVDEGRKLYSRQELSELALKLIDTNRTKGKAGNLEYQIAAKESYTLVAFIDVTLVESDMDTLIRTVFVVGTAALVLMVLISLYVSDRIILPLEENDRRQKRFVSDASHELKTPIAVIDMNAELLSRQIGENEWLTNIRYESERMGELVKRLLDLSYAEKADEVREEVDLSRIVTGEMLAFENLAYDHKKAMHGDIDEGIFFTGDRLQLTRVVSVLLDNAIRHSSEASDIDVSLKQEGNRIILKVTNEGEKIPPEVQKHLFDRFYRADEARNSEGNHYGLGLAIAKAVVEKYAGNIAVSCYEGKVEFSVFLPVR